MENSKANKLIHELLEEVKSNGINQDFLVPELQKLRTFALEENKPSVVKSLRLAYEHLAKNNSFEIAIPDDEPIDEASNIEKVYGRESLEYYLSLFLDLNNRHNLSDIKEYNEKLQNL